MSRSAQPAGPDFVEHCPPLAEEETLSSGSSSKQLRYLWNRLMQAVRSSQRSLDRLCRRGSHECGKKRTPSPLCCLGIMHIRTATYWIAYAEMMWITSQFAFWTAQLVVGCTHWALLTVGFASVLIQSVLVHQLCQGVKYFVLRSIRVYQLGLLVRMIACVIFTAIAVFFLQEKPKEDEEELPKIFSFVHNPHSLIKLKAAFAILQFVLQAYAFWIARRCHSYIKFTADTLSEQKVTVVDPEKGATTAGMPTNGCSLTSAEFHEMRRAPSLIIKCESRANAKPPPAPSPLSLPTIHGNGCTSSAPCTSNATRLLTMQPQTDC